MRVALYRQHCEIFKRLLRTRRCQGLGEQQATKRLRHLNVDQVWRMKTLGRTADAPGDHFTP